VGSGKKSLQREEKGKGTHHDIEQEHAVYKKPLLREGAGKPNPFVLFDGRIGPMKRKEHRLAKKKEASEKKVLNAKENN